MYTIIMNYITSTLGVFFLLLNNLFKYILLHLFTPNSPNELGFYSFQFLNNKCFSFPRNVSIAG